MRLRSLARIAHHPGLSETVYSTLTRRASEGNSSAVPRLNSSAVPRLRFGFVSDVALSRLLCILVSLSCLWATNASLFAAEESRAKPAADERTSRDEPANAAESKDAADDAGSIKTGYAGHYSCRAFDGLARDLCIAASDEEPEEVKRLLKAGANVEARSSRSHTKGMTILQVAAWHGWSEKAIELLIGAHADVNAKDQRGNTALIYATQNLVVNAPVIELLIRSGADVNAKGEKGMTALMHAALHDKTTQVVKSLVDAGADVAARDKAGWTALMHATRRKRECSPLVEFLIAAGSDVNAAHNHGGTALSSAAYKGYAETVKLLIKAGARVNASDEDGWTPLLCASNNGHVEVVRLLLAAGADLNSKDKAGRSPLSVAANHGHTETARLLIQAGAK